MTNRDTQAENPQPTQRVPQLPAGALPDALVRRALQSAGEFAASAGPLYRKMDAILRRQDLLTDISPIARLVSQDFAAYISPTMKVVEAMCAHGQASRFLGNYAQGALTAHQELDALLGSAALNTTLATSSGARLARLLDSPLIRNIPRALESIILTERFSERLDFGLLASRMGLAVDAIGKLLASHNAFADAYERFSGVLLAQDAGFDVALQSALPRATASYYLHTEILNHLAGEDDDPDVADASGQLQREIRAENTDRVTALLDEFDPALVVLLQGARERVRMPAADAIRQTTVSLRELICHCLRRMSPDEAVRKWSNDPAMYKESGEPTWGARLLYAMRDVANGALARLVTKDVEAALALLKVLNEGTHAVAAEIQDAQLQILVTRTEVLLVLLLEVRATGLE